MELLELRTRVLEIFNIEDVQTLGSALFDCVNKTDEELLDRYVQEIGELETDSLQKIYQYYLADRDGKKQDFTPVCLAELLSELIDDSDNTIDDCVDLCAGTGALTIQRWARRPKQTFELYEIDESVIPFLLFNLVVRNIEATVYVGDALADETTTAYYVRRGVKYATLFNLKSTL